mmetsp:Transcript_40115/g.103889  ORF Transcript_40115/g.103889 Transcript_40115/m.103889 type:complete len:204 (+) Transcript_40115:5066-5677(+)
MCSSEPSFPSSTSATRYAPTTSAERWIGSTSMSSTSYVRGASSTVWHVNSRWGRKREKEVEDATGENVKLEVGHGWRFSPYRACSTYIVSVVWCAAMREGGRQLGREENEATNLSSPALHLRSIEAFMPPPKEVEGGKRSSKLCTPASDKPSPPLTASHDSTAGVRHPPHSSSKAVDMQSTAIVALPASKLSVEVVKILFFSA